MPRNPHKVPHNFLGGTRQQCKSSHTVSAADPIAGMRFEDGCAPGHIYKAYSAICMHDEMVPQAIVQAGRVAEVEPILQQQVIAGGSWAAFKLLVEWTLAMQKNMNVK